MKKTKIIYFDIQLPNLLSNKNQPFGGAAVEWFVWLNSFVKLKNDAALLTWKGAKDIIKKPTKFEIIESYHSHKGIPKLRLLTYRLPMLFFSIKKYNPHYIVQECANEFTGIFAFIAKLLNKTFVHRIASDMDVDGKIARNFSKRSLSFYYYGLKNANHISCQNEYQYEILKKKFPQKSISILYNAIEIKRSLNKNLEKEYIAWVGNFRYEKNLPALAIIAERLPQYKFKIAGTKTYSSDDDTIIGINMLEKLTNVEFVGHIDHDEITDFLSKSYFLLNTSVLEGFPNTFSEAWSAGVPVITTKNVNPDNLINKFNLGIVAENYESLPEIVNEMITLKKYSDFEERCFNYVSENHNPEILAQQFLSDMELCRKN